MSKTKITGHHLCTYIHTKYEIDRERERDWHRERERERERETGRRRGRRVRASFSPEILQAGAVKGLINRVERTKRAGK